MRLLLDRLKRAAQISAGTPETGVNSPPSQSSPGPNLLGAGKAEIAKIDEQAIQFRQLSQRAAEFFLALASLQQAIRPCRGITDARKAVGVNGTKRPRGTPGGRCEWSDAQAPQDVAPAVEREVLRTHGKPGAKGSAIGIE